MLQMFRNPQLKVSWQAVKMCETGAQPENFQGRGGFLEFGHFDIRFMVRHTKELPQDTLKTAILN